MTIFVVFWELQDSGSEFDRAYLKLKDAQARKDALNRTDDWKAWHVVEVEVEDDPKRT